MHVVNADTGAAPTQPAALAAAGGRLRRSWPTLLGAAVLLVVFVPLAWQASALVWSGALAIGVAFAPAAIGVYLTFRVLDFPDLTVDASFPAGAAIAAVVITNGLSPWLGLPGAFALGAAFGALTGIAHILLRINSLLASILTVTAAFTINLRVQGSANVPLLGVDTIYTPFLSPMRDLLEGWFGDTGVQIHRNVVTMLVSGVLLAFVILVLHVFFRTEVGIAMRATVAGGMASGTEPNGVAITSPRADAAKDAATVLRAKSAGRRGTPPRVVNATAYTAANSIPKAAPAITLPRARVCGVIGAVMRRWMLPVLRSSGRETACMAPAPKSTAAAIIPGAMAARVTPPPMA